MLSRMPLTKAPLSALPKRLAISTASLIVTFTGISGQSVSSNAAMRRMFLSTEAMRETFQFVECCEMQLVDPRELGAHALDQAVGERAHLRRGVVLRPDRSNHLARQLPPEVHLVEHLQRALS